LILGNSATFAMQAGNKPLENPNPVVYDVQDVPTDINDRDNRNEDEVDEFDSLEIFGIGPQRLIMT